MTAKILIVDDEPNNLDVLRNCLSEAGFKVPVVESGETALELVEHIKPDLILLDVMMPGIDGFETCRRLKKNEVTKNTPIIFISAKTESVDKIEGFEIGGVDYITKPFQAVEVIARVNKHLTIRNLQKQLETQNAVLRKNEEQLRKFSRAIEQTANTIVITDTYGSIEFVNPAFTAKTGYSYVEAIGQNPRILKSGKHPLAFYEKLWATITAGHVWEGEMLNKRKNGEFYWEFATISPIKETGGKITHYVAIKEDITEQKQAAEKLQQVLKSAEQAKKEADSANRAKSAFLASMSHELRTPLNGILGFAQILQRDTEITPQQQHGLNIIEQSGNHLLSLINDVLDLAKVESGKIELHEVDFNLPSLLNDVSEIIKIRAEDKGINFYLESADELPNGVHGDERRLRQILLNLLGNAIKFTDHGSVTLKVNFKKGKHEGKHEGKHIGLPLQTQCRSEPACSPNLPQTCSPGYFHFKIEDTGVGISPENLETIFKPFEQVGEQKRQAKGTGLGLAISKNLVELMGGQLCVSSKLNVGTQFWFELTLLIVDYNVAKVSTQQPIIGLKGKPRKILVVDDNEENQAVVVDLLSPLGFKVKPANDGREGLETAISWQPDVIITDLLMPAMDGFELIHQLRQSPQLKDKIIIASSASVYDADKNRSLALGSNVFLPKPIQVETVLEQLQHHLNLTWIYGDKIEEAVEETTSLVFPPVAELEKLYELSLIGDICELEEQVAILAKSDVKLKSFVTKMQIFLKKYQVDELSEWLEEEMMGV